MRTAGEYQGGHIPGAVNVGYLDLGNNNVGSGNGTLNVQDGAALTVANSLLLGNPTGASGTVAVLPGSRNHEIAQNFLIQIKVMQKLHRAMPGVSGAFSVNTRRGAMRGSITAGSGRRRSAAIDFRVEVHVDRK